MRTIKLIKNKNMNKKYISFLIVSLLATGILVAVPAFAQTGQGVGRGVMGRGGQRNGMMGVVGTVATVNGTTLTVTSKGRPVVNSTTATTTTYTVDASNATVTKNNATSSVSNIAVGDEVLVQGTVTGTNVVAKTIRDGVVQPVIQGNGQPVVAGKITTISGNSITITNASNVTYTVDATNAKFVVRGATSPTILSVVIGDNVVIQGTVNGNSIVASSVLDQKAKTNNGTVNFSGNPKPRDFMGGMMNGIGNFFKHLFGF